MIETGGALVRIGSLAAVVLAVAGCDTWFGGQDDPPLPGQRIAVMESSETLSPDGALSGAPIQISSPTTNAAWPLAGGNAAANPDHPALNYPLSRVWATDVGTGSGSIRRVTARPIVAGGTVYTMDAEGRVAAVDATSGNQRWRVRVGDPDERGRGQAGGLAFADGKLFATTGFGEVVAVDPSNGGLIWTRKIGAPIRSAPTVAGNTVYAITANNQMHALDAGNGQPRWSHTAIEEPTGLLGGAGPSIAPGVAIAPYSSGDIYALRQESGLELWVDSVATLRRGRANISDVTADVVIDGPIAIASGQSGRMIAVDVRSGARIWEQQAGGGTTPWLDGDTVFAVTSGNQVVALSRTDGRVRWARQLDRYRYPDSQTDPLLWSGPILAGGRLIAVGSHGTAAVLDPRSGEVVDSFEIGAGSSVPPVVANGTLYVLDDNATLIAYR
ncbi:PQQ-binding-like beta-propeller repeat protein [Fodinicurvata sp. EGI_FJ10296]|uniref:outer membrane protein assembly factor BamB family protein n=1 Tax=Fodinicurvata sp. EGI_FJ10296 TaxID=3231908 RepID=UPI0034554BE6